MGRRIAQWGSTSVCRPSVGGVADKDHQHPSTCSQPPPALAPVPVSRRCAWALVPSLAACTLSRMGTGYFAGPCSRTWLQGLVCLEPPRSDRELARETAWSKCPAHYGYGAPMALGLRAREIACCVPPSCAALPPRPAARGRCNWQQGTLTPTEFWTCQVRGCEFPGRYRARPAVSAAALVWSGCPIGEAKWSGTSSSHSYTAQPLLPIEYRRRDTSCVAVSWLVQARAVAHLGVFLSRTSFVFSAVWFCL